MTINDDSTLREIREYLGEHGMEGVDCPCCEQFVKVYRRSLASSAGRVLIAMWRKAGADWVHVPGLGEQGGDPLKARFWGLIERDQSSREDGSSRTGWWRLTPSGVAFVQDRHQVPKYAHIYNNIALLLDGPQVSIRDVLGKKFRYDELMGQ